MSDVFTFKDVLFELGISTIDKKRNQVAGRLLSVWAKEAGVLPIRELMSKTDANSKVPAPHCICTYPMSRFEEALNYVKTNLTGVDERQLALSL
jgi:hypothetical protein